MFVDKDKHRSPIYHVLPVGIEPTLQAPQACVLSIELREEISHLLIECRRRGRHPDMLSPGPREECCYGTRKYHIRKAIRQ